MKRLHLIVSNALQPKEYESLERAARVRGIETRHILSDSFNFARNIVLTEEDALYRVAIGVQPSLVEKWILNERVSTFYENIRVSISRHCGVLGSILIHEKNNLPIIKTIFSLTNDRNLLAEYVEALDGFPIIIKAMGGSHGVGVMKIDSLDSLFSVVDVLLKHPGTYIMRKYIDVASHARLIVLDRGVVGSIEYEKVENDFRSNVGKALHVRKRAFGELIEDIAVRSVRSIGLEFGGVDILIDRDGKPHIAEVNFPCFFPRTEMATGIDIAGKMVDYLMEKSKTMNNAPRVHENQ